MYLEVGTAVHKNAQKAKKKITMSRCTLHQGVKTDVYDIYSPYRHDDSGALDKHTQHSTRSIRSSGTRRSSKLSRIPLSNRVAMTILTITHKFTAIIHRSGTSHLELDQNTGSALPANSRAVSMACLCVPWWSLPDQMDAN